MLKASGKKYLAAIIAAFILYTLFVWVSALAEGGVFDAFDLAAEQAVFSRRSPGLTTLFETVTYFGNTASIVCLSLLLLTFPETRFRYGVPAAAAAILTTALRIVVKNIVERPRPDSLYALIEQGGFSYPSGHAITSVAVYGILAWLILYYHRQEKNESAAARRMPGKEKALLFCSIFLAIAIGPTRVYLGVHHPTDILGGWLAGIATAILIAAVTVTFCESERISEENK